jgi:hypothetical protein
MLTVVKERILLSAVRVDSPLVGLLVYTMAGRAVPLDLSKVSRSYAVASVDDAGGPAQASRQTVSGGQVVTLEPPAEALGRPLGRHGCRGLDRHGDAGG